MTAAVGARPRLERRARGLAWATIAWNIVEGIVAVAAGAVVLWHLRGAPEERERRALRLIAVSFFAIAAYVVAEAVRDPAVGTEAGESGIGIGLAAVSLGVMPTLAWAKRRTGRALGNPVVVADSTETALCSYLSAVCSPDWW